MPCSLPELAALPKHLNASGAVKDHGEAGPRAVVSRAYYAAFHQATAAVEKHLPAAQRSPSNGVHKALVEDVAAIGDIRTNEKGLWISLANKLNSLREKRVVADYYLQEHFCPQKAFQYVNMADAFCRQISKY